MYTTEENNDMNSMNSGISFEYTQYVNNPIDPRNINRQVIFYDRNHNEQGYFYISGYSFDLIYENEVDIYPNSMSIHINNPYRSWGFSQVLIIEMIKGIKQHNPNIKPTQLLFIDTDVSDGFWDYIGMNSVPHNCIEGNGYDKYISFGNLCDYANHKTYETDDVLKHKI